MITEEAMVDAQLVEINVTEGPLEGVYHVPVAALESYRADDEDVAGFADPLRLLATVTHMQAQTADDRLAAKPATKPRKTTKKATRPPT